MDGLTMLVIAGTVFGCTTFLVAAFKARGYAARNAREASRKGSRDLRGLAWIALAACGALYVYTSLEFLARTKESQAEITQRKTIVASLDRQVSIHRDGLRKLQGILSRVKGPSATASPETMVEDIEKILGEVRSRERNFR